jgi:hypothetical protein
MNRSERLEKSFREPIHRWACGDINVGEVIVPTPTHPMPGNDESRSQAASIMCRSREFRWLVEYHLGRDEARMHYPEAYLDY